MAAPTPMPAKPSSAMGVSMTRSGPKLVEHALADLVGAVVFGYFFAHQEHGRIAAHLFRHGFPQCLSELYFSHGLNLWK
jgi:hypothetical protein